MDLMDVIKTMRRIRRLKAAFLPEDILKKALTATRLAPSACNSKSWKTVVLRDEQTELRLAAEANGQKFIASAPLVLVACGYT